jgi:hypothetical protein
LYRFPLGIISMIKLPPSIAAVCLLAATIAYGQDWPQFQFDAANQGRAPAVVPPPYQLRWVWYGEDNVALGGRPYPPGKVPRPPRDTVGLLSFTMHPVVAEGRVVFGDLEGALYCLNSKDGSTHWVRRFPGAFVHAAAIEKSERRNTIVAACQDGRIYGLDWDGTIRWSVKARRPLVTPVKLNEGVAFAGSLDGMMYAVDVATGTVRWTYDAGAAIRQPAAISGGRVFFGAESMHFQALDAATGKLLWRTAPGQMTGQSFRNTWPVVVGDRVMTFQVLVDGASEYVMEALLYNATPGDHRQKRLEDWPQERQAILDWLAGDMTWAVDIEKHWQQHPGRIRPETHGAAWAGGPLRKSFYGFDVAGNEAGQAVEPFHLPMGIVGGTGNANMGPVLDARGVPITWWRVSARSIITGGGFGTAFAPDLSGLDLTTGDRVILPTTRDIHRGGPGMELDNHHMLTSAGEYLYYHNPFRQARWIKLDGRENPQGNISAVYGQHDGGGWQADVVYYATKGDAGDRGSRIFDSHGAARTPVVIADGALFVNEVDIRALACYETRTADAAEGLPETEAPRKSESKESLAAIPAEGSRRPASDYVWRKRTAVDVSPQADDLKAILAEQVRAMIDAGHLGPYWAKRGELDGRWYFTNPGDTIGALARAYPHLPAPLQAETRRYLQAETAEYPPWGDRLNTPSDQGASRMDFQVPPHLWEWKDGSFYQQLPRLHNVYSLWLYADATGDWDSVRGHWPEIKSFYEKHRKDAQSYLGGAAGAIGLSRVAHRLGDNATATAAEQDAIEALAALEREAAMREPLFRRYGFDTKWHGEFNFQGYHLLSLTPETAGCIRDRALLRNQVLSHVETATLHWPMWFVSQASAFTRHYGESHALPPDFSAMIFPVKALVEQSPPEQLRRWVDAEDSPRGDLFFMERLVLAIESHGIATWRDIRE